jgi:hypothetical protein
MTGFESPEAAARLRRDGSITVDVKVIPRASKNEVLAPAADGSLRVKVAAVPEKGKANEAVRELLASHYGVTKAQVEIVTGQTSQRKRVRIRA